MSRQSTECVDLYVSLWHWEFLHGSHIVLARQDASLQDMVSQVDNFERSWRKQPGFLWLTFSHPQQCDHHVGPISKEGFVSSLYDLGLKWS